MARLLTILSLTFVTTLSIISCYETYLPAQKESNDSVVLSLDLDQMMHNPYPQACKRKSKMTPEEIRAMNICIMKEKWNRVVLMPLESRYARRSGPQGIEVSLKIEREDMMPDVHATDGSSEDCHFHDRKTVRPFNGECRTRDINKKKSKETWLELWKEIQGDFSFMYDYVLWDEEHADRKENKLWYLIHYVKNLAVMIEDPNEILAFFNSRDRDQSLLRKLRNVDLLIDKLSDNMIAALMKIKQRKTVSSSYLLTNLSVAPVPMRDES